MHYVLDVVSDKEIIEKQDVFYPRADNLAQWLQITSKKLGYLSQKLSANSKNNKDHAIKWLDIDDIFHEARGSCWALINLMRGVQIDFQPILMKKNIHNFNNIINELQKTQEKIASPIIMNGKSFGLTANHLLVMANYISRANATIIDLVHLLKEG